MICSHSTRSSSPGRCLGDEARRHICALALRLARRGYGTTSPNPMVGAVLVKGGKIIGRGWHHRAGEPHAEIEALRDARDAGTCGQRRDALRDAGAVLHARPHAALHGGHHGGGNQTRRGRRD